MDRSSRVVMRITCPDRSGIVSDVSSLLFRLGVNIHHADQHLDAEANLFFQRIEFPAPANWAEVKPKLSSALSDLKMQHSIRQLNQRPRIGVLVSKHAHCALDLLDRHRTGEFDCDIAVVLSNHPDLKEEITRRGYEFIHEPIVDKDRPAQEKRLLERLAAAQVEFVVLARYMQILSANFVNAYPQRVINIHHSFLPAFAGAEPYRQAFRKGVKLIGATSHYVTEHLDEGPIIAQGVTRVSHRDTVQDMERKGKDLERIVLAEAVRCQLDDRIIAYGNKTVVFE